MKKARKKKSKVRYDEAIYLAQFGLLHGPVPVFASWLPDVYAFMPAISLVWISADKELVSIDNQSLN